MLVKSVIVNLATHCSTARMLCPCCWLVELSKNLSLFLAVQSAGVELSDLRASHFDFDCGTAVTALHALHAAEVLVGGLNPNILS